MARKAKSAVEKLRQELHHEEARLAHRITRARERITKVEHLATARVKNARQNIENARAMRRGGGRDPPAQEPCLQQSGSHVSDTLHHEQIGVTQQHGPVAGAAFNLGVACYLGIDTRAMHAERPYLLMMQMCEEFEHRVHAHKFGLYSAVPAEQRPRGNGFREPTAEVTGEESARLPEVVSAG